MYISELRDFLEIGYDGLEDLNLEAKHRASSGLSSVEIRKHYMDYLAGEKRIKALTVCFSDLEGRLHMLDYDKKYLLESHQELIFDGSSVRGYSDPSDFDLRLEIDWSSFRWLPSDVFGAGKVIVFASVCHEDGTPHACDMRSKLAQYCEQLKSEKDKIPYMSVECEGFLFKGLSAEQGYNEVEGFQLVSAGGYLNSLPRDPLRLFIDRIAETQRSLGFQNEKDHPEMAPSQFELNYRKVEALAAADQVQLYKLVARQVAANMGFTASFLPQPVSGINGNSMHTYISFTDGAGNNLFFDKAGDSGLSDFGWSCIDRILHNANDICLFLNPSVNSYRNLEQGCHAPNQIKASSTEKESMIGIPFNTKKSARIEVRAVAPDANPYLAFFSLLKTALEGPEAEASNSESRRTRTRFLPGNINDSIRLFKQSDFSERVLSQEEKNKYVELKRSAANRCPLELGTQVKSQEILFHHEVTNQYLWSRF